MKMRSEIEEEKGRMRESGRERKRVIGLISSTTAESINTSMASYFQGLDGPSQKHHSRVTRRYTCSRSVHDNGIPSYVLRSEDMRQAPIVLHRMIENLFAFAQTSRYV